MNNIERLLIGFFASLINYLLHNIT